jgi:glucokinase
MFGLEAKRVNQTAVGIDIGATYTKFGLMRKSGELIASGRMDTGGDFHSYLDSLAGHVKEMITSAGEQVNTAGIGCPNGNFYTGDIEHAANLPWKGILPVVNELSGRLGMPATMTNDANAAAIGEMIYGGASDMKDFIVITLGTGLGGGIVSGGKLVHGHHGMAGELGHTLAQRNGRKCGCGKSGCLETYVSAPGIVRTAMEFMAKYKEDSPLRCISFSKMTSEDVAAAALEGDPIAARVFEYSGQMLGIKLADTAAHTDPEAIFIFGGLANAGSLIIEPAQKYMDDNLQPVLKNRLPILRSRLPGSTGAIAGACALAFAGLTL